MKVLRFQVQREHIRKQSCQRARNIPDRIGLQVGRGVERSDPQCFGVLDVHGLSLLLNGPVRNTIARALRMSAHPLMKASSSSFTLSSKAPRQRLRRVAPIETLRREAPASLRLFIGDAPLR